MNASLSIASEFELSQSEKLELYALTGHQDDNEEDEEDGEYAPPSRVTLSPAEYVRQRCLLDRNDMIRNGLHPNHVSQARRSMPVGWAW